MTRCQSTVILLAISMLSQIGCGIGYNGAWLLAPFDRKVVQAHQKFMQEREQARAQSRAERKIRTQQINFDGQTGDRARISLTRSEQSRGPLVQPRPVGMSTQPRPRDKRFLFGQISNHAQPLASPMDGTANLQQVTFATEGADFDPSLDPTGNWIVYASTQHRDSSDLYVKATDGTAIRQLTDDPANDQTPSFSPDGKWVAYSSNRAGNWDIYLVSIDGGASRQITSSPDDEIHPSFSPDGKQLIYCTLGPRSGQWELVVIEIDNPATPIFIGHGLFPRWSPTSNLIAYQRAREKGSRYFGIWTMELINGEGMRPTQIVAGSNAAAITPSWSPDGTRLVFCTIIDPDSDLQQGTPLQSDIWVVNVDGTGRTNLTRSRFANLQPTWAPDGSVYFVSNRGRNGTENIWSSRTERALEVAGSPPASQSAEASTP